MLIPANRPLRRAAFTLVEMTVSVGISTVIMGMIMYAFIFSSRSFMAMGNYVDLNKASLKALDKISSDIREAGSLKTFATNQLVFRDSNSNDLTYAWSPNSQLLTRTSGGTTTTMLKNCDYLLFDISQRTPTSGGTAMAFFSASNNPAICKLVSVSWRCSRTILGQKVNTESVQTAKIVMRN